MKNHFDISGSIKIREVDIAGVACTSSFYIRNFKPLVVSAADQAGLSLTWSQTPEDMFSRDMAHILCIPLISCYTFGMTEVCMSLCDVIYISLCLYQDLFQIALCTESWSSFTSNSDIHGVEKWLWG